MTREDDESEPTDLALWQRAVRGEVRAQDAIYRRHGPRLYREVLWPVLRDATRAGDALCETFVAALPALHRFDPARGRDEGSALWAWLAQIARRKALDELRRDQRVVRLRTALQDEACVQEDAPAALDPHRALVGAEAARERGARVEAVLATLHPRYALALRLRLLAGWEREACAEALEVKVATFDVVLHRAVKAFRSGYLARYGEEPQEEA